MSNTRNNDQAWVRARRAEALNRFKIDPVKAANPTDGAGYVERKNVELAALKARV